MSKMITVRFKNGESRQYHNGVTLLQISEAMQSRFETPIVTAKVNNDIKDLQFKVKEDCTVEFFDLKTDLGNKVYQRSLTFVMVIAAKALFPQGEVTVEHSLSKGLYCELHIGRKATQFDIDLLEEEMRKIIAEKRPILLRSIPIDEGARLFNEAGQSEKVRHLKQMKREMIRVYNCGDVYGYFYGNMAPNTSYTPVFELCYYEPGFILRFPEKKAPDRLPKFNVQRKLADIFLEAESWGSILQCDYVATLNEQVEAGKGADIIRIAEALHEKKIAQIADFVAQNRNEARVILVAGPSSSGKTTFAQRLNIQLRVNGVRPVPISLDDYFVNRDSTPCDENGEPDFEAIEAIDLALFNEHLRRILDGEEVETPFYNFKTGKREYRGHKIKIERGQPLIIEGIHGLNERLTQVVPRDQKIKIYISALTQLSIDSHNRIPTTDARLIRRIVRDSEFRGHDAVMTLGMWPSVRRGEEKNIFPYQEEADIMFNSALIYELGILKKYAEPLLAEVTSDLEVYSEAKRLLNFLSYFRTIEDEDVPPNSILREFIGQSCFYK